MQHQASTGIEAQGSFHYGALHRSLPSVRRGGQICRLCSGHVTSKHADNEINFPLERHRVFSYLCENLVALSEAAVHVLLLFWRWYDVIRLPQSSSGIYQLQRVVVWRRDDAALGQVYGTWSDVGISICKMNAISSRLKTHHGPKATPVHTELVGSGWQLQGLNPAITGVFPFARYATPSGCVP